MQTRALTVSNPKEQAEARSRLLRAAVSIVVERAPDHDMATVFNAFLTHVAKDNNLDLTRPIHVARAEAIIAVTLNLGLEIHAGEDANKAALALFKKPIPVFKLGERTVAELRNRIAKVIKKAVISVKSGRKYKYYGVTDTETEQQLAEWNQGQLTDHPLLPPATRSEIQRIELVLDRVEQEIRLSRKVNWLDIFGRNQGTCNFAAEHFRRPKQHILNPAGGVWRPFVTSLVAKVLTSTWDKSRFFLGNQAQINLERYLVITEDALREILELVMFEPEEINRKAIEAAAKITAAALNQTDRWNVNSVFSSNCNDEEIHEILDLAAQALESFAHDARAFYLAIASVERPSRAELDRFWRSRLLLHNDSATRPLQDRLNEEEALHHQPWKRLPDTRNLTEVLSCIAGFAVWPIEERIGFVSEYNFERVVTKERDFEDAAKLLLKIFELICDLEGDQNDYVQMIAEQIDWRSRSKLVAEICRLAKSELFNDQLNWISTQTQWNKEALNNLNCGNVYGVGLGPAIQAIGHNLNENDWRNLTPVGMGPSTERVGIFFSALDDQQRVRFVVSLDTMRMGGYLDGLPIKQILELFAPIAARIKSDPEYKKEFERWYGGFAGSYSNQLRLKNPEADRALNDLLNN